MTYDWMHAFLINAGYTTLLKEVIHRERPNGEDNLAFPSGHASNAFTWRLSPSGTMAGKRECPRTRWRASWPCRGSS